MINIATHNYFVSKDANDDDFQLYCVFIENGKRGIRKMFMYLLADLMFTSFVYIGSAFLFIGIVVMGKLHASNEFISMSLAIAILGFVYHVVLVSRGYQARIYEAPFSFAHNYLVPLDIYKVVHDKNDDWDSIKNYCYEHSYRVMKNNCSYNNEMRYWLHSEFYEDFQNKINGLDYEKETVDFWEYYDNRMGLKEAPKPVIKPL